MQQKPVIAPVDRAMDDDAASEADRFVHAAGLLKVALSIGG